MSVPRSLTLDSAGTAPGIRPAAAWALGLGIAGGVVFVLSPMAVWFALAMAVLVVCAPIGLTERDRRWLLRIIVAALLLRSVVLAVQFLWLTHPAWFSRDAIEILDGERSVASLFGDEVYTKRRTLWMRDVWLGLPIAPANLFWAFQKPYGWTGYYYVIAYLQVLFGPAPFGIHFVNTGVYLIGAMLLYRLVRRSLGSPTALGGLALTLFVPSLFIWSISALKEPFYFGLGAVALAGTAWSLRARTWPRRIIWAVAAIVATLANDAVRPGAGVLTIAAVTIACASVWVIGRTSRLIAIAGVGLLVAVLAASLPAIRTAMMANVRAAAHKHLSNVQQPGVSYRTLDARFYTGHGAIESMTEREAAAFVIRGIASFVAVPLPWRVDSRSAIVFLPQHMLWYALVLALPWGVAAGLRRDPLVTMLLLCYAAANALAIALGDGNVGTLVRHRDGVVPFVVWLSAMGAVALAARVAPRAVEVA